MTFIVLAFLFALVNASSWIQYPPNGFATMTHYDLPSGYIASCACTGKSTNYPTSAMNQMAFGSAVAYGSACGKCFNLTLLNTFLSDPPFYPPTSKSIVVKVTDLCPLSTTGWCNATQEGPNQAGNYLNFDLAYPSSAIPDDFFPSNASLYGYTDFGVWNISYQSVDCSNWAGWKDEGALGSVTNLGPESACCPDNPSGNVNDTCPSYSDHNGIAPDTRTSGSPSTISSSGLFVLSVSLLTVYTLL
ncbi:hypothetical protein D9758_001939 [Tetrapyrgos nigripes]|uniref:Expansin-like EG45 domain-containing protein n=1 Tax=Tetrapyrgos nigripes TaxID=182062 RepID=A0A8H5GTC8_9AGAR|nr:hypothetical protein D9758_001939 [Tetrapyrgos nigripes]